MKVMLLTDRVGETFAQREGDVIDLPDDEAMRLIRSGQAEAFSAPVECATVAPTENAAQKFNPKPRKFSNGKRLAQSH